MLDQRRRRWPNIETTMDQCLAISGGKGGGSGDVFAGCMALYCIYIAACCESGPDSMAAAMPLVVGEDKPDDQAAAHKSCLVRVPPITWRVQTNWWEPPGGVSRTFSTPTRLTPALRTTTPLSLSLSLSLSLLSCCYYYTSAASRRSRFQTFAVTFRRIIIYRAESTSHLPSLLVPIHL